MQCVGVKQCKILSMLCLQTMSRAMSSSKKAQLFPSAMKSSWGQRAGIREHLEEVEKEVLQ